MTAGADSGVSRECVRWRIWRIDLQTTEVPRPVVLVDYPLIEDNAEVAAEELGRPAEVGRVSRRPKR